MMISIFLQHAAEGTNQYLLIHSCILGKSERNLGEGTDRKNIISNKLLGVGGIICVNT